MSHRFDTGEPQSELTTDERMFQVVARNLIGSLFVVLKAALMEGRGLGPAISRFRMILNEFIRKHDDAPALQFIGGGVFVNKRLVRADLPTWEKARFIGAFFARLKIAELCFDDHATEQSIRDFISVARHAADAGEGSESLSCVVFPGISCRDLDAGGLTRSDDPLIIPDPIRVVRAYGGLVVTVRHLLQELSRRRAPCLVPLRRALQELLRLPPRTHSLQLGLLSLEHYRAELAGRQARIGLIVVMMGRRLELGVADLREVGLAAIVAGAGRALSQALTFAPVDRCREIFLKTSQIMAASAGPGRSGALHLIATTELGRLDDIRRGHPLSRMIAVAEAYEHLTTKSPAGPGLAPSEAQQQISGVRHVDPAAARLLIATLGLFPVGSMVKLSSGETAIIVECPRESERPSQPKVMVVADPNGRPTRKRIVDLAETDDIVTGTVDMSKLDLNVGHFLFS
jgi:hypothetical protein